MEPTTTETKSVSPAFQEAPTDNLPVAGFKAAPRNLQPFMAVGLDHGDSKLAAALAQARDACGEVPKNGFNTWHKYFYSTAQDIYATGKAALARTGLSLLPLAPKFVVLGSGTNMCFGLKRRLLLVHASGESVDLGEIEWPVCPDKGRPIEKAYASAITTSLAYYMRDLLQMPSSQPDEDQAGASVPAPVDETPPSVGPVDTTRTGSPSDASAVINAAQVQELGELLTDGKVDHAKFNAHYHIAGLEQLPQQHYYDARTKLLTRCRPTSTQCDQIDRLCREKGLGLAQLKEFLPGVADVRETNRLQAVELIVKLEAYHAGNQA